ncbi:MAG: hypothetical protein PG979_000326 [Rickettsia asembonensis]|nr:palindromic element RPE3 domain-containing protein [Rickettsia asembonensis]WCR56269.1 MAG: hypothetical protein PG979_000326 [Rickettsia asembonensis]
MFYFVGTAYSEIFRQDEFKCKPAKAVDKLREYSQIIQNSLASTL